MPKFNGVMSISSSILIHYRKEKLTFLIAAPISHKTRENGEIELKIVKI